MSALNGNTTHECEDCRATPIILLVGSVGPAKRRTAIELCDRCYFRRSEDASATALAMEARG